MPGGLQVDQPDDESLDSATANVSRSRFRAYLELLRLPNVFTAMADVLLGFLFTYGTLQPWQTFALLLGSSTLLYLSGMVLNDLFDREVDARERPERPIPSGRVSVATARGLGFGMLTVGIALGWGASYYTGEPRPGIVATILALAVLLYNAVFKPTLAAPLAMGSCRLLNVLLGMSAAVGPWLPVNWLVADGIGLYIVGVTWFARTEARRSSRPQLVLATLVMLCGIGLLAWYPQWRTGDESPPIIPQSNWLFFWSAIGVLTTWRCLRAVVYPQPAVVQAAVKSCILALIVLDAAACVPAAGIQWAVVILLLMLPAVTLGNWIYST